MSKSDKDVNETIFLLEDVDVARKKIMTALTDSENEVRYDVEKKPGVSNLITIYSSIKDITISEGENELKKMNYKEFKETVANEVVDLLNKIQKKYNSITDVDIRESLDVNIKYIQKEADKSVEKIKRGYGVK